MSYISRIVLPAFAAAAIVSCVAVTAQDTGQTRYTPRELFYQAVDDKAPEKAAPKKGQAQGAEKGPRKGPASNQQGEVATSNRPTPPAGSEEAARKGSASNQQADAATSNRPTPPVGAKVVPAVQTAPAPAHGIALGLKYSVLKMVGGNLVDVPVDTPFRADDRIQLRVQTNAAGYLYVVNQGSSGTWKPMFPAPEVASGDNRVNGWQDYTLPAPGLTMRFDQRPGIENLFVVFSREPVPDFEELIYSLKEKIAPASPATQPSRPAPKQKHMIAMADVNIPDSSVGRLRKTYARDLIVEKVEMQAPPVGGQRETAVYVVNPSGSDDSRVVADLKLVHQ
jgi:hypothetical protein